MPAAGTAEKIKRFRNLPTGWHYGEGVLPSRGVVNAALQIHANAVIAGLMDTDAFLGISGEVRVTAYSPFTDLEFTVEPNGSITFVREDRRTGTETDYRQNLLLRDVLSILSDVGRELWASFGFSTTGTTITALDAFNPWFSETRRMVREYR